MKNNVDIEKEVMTLFENSAPTEDTLKEIKELELPKIENDPRFMASVAKGQIIEDILAAMELENINRTMLAKRLGKSKQYVSRILNETANFTIDSIAEIACALNHEIEVRIVGRAKSIIVVK